MTDQPLDAPLFDHTDASLARPLPAALAAARSDIVATARDLLTLTDQDLVRPWSWIGGSEEEVRYGAYRAAEALEQAEIEARLAMAAADSTERRAARIVGPATAARWDLHGLLLPIGDRLLDADPGDGEWSIREVLGHVISGQRTYGWTSAWWQTRGHRANDPDLPAHAPEWLIALEPDESTTEAAGRLDDLRARLDATLDLSAERLAGLPDDRLDLGARWSGFPVTIGFRLGRWSSHIREHAIQIEKTYAMLGHVPNESERLVRHLLAAYGRAEAVVFGRTAADAAAERVARGVTEARDAVRSVVGAAAAGA